EVIEKANNPPLSGDFDLNLILDDLIEENHAATNENTAPSSAKLRIVQGQDVPEVDFDWEALEFKTVKEAIDYYRDYAHSLGFEIKIRSTNKNNSKALKTNKVRYIHLTCTKKAFKDNSDLDPNNQDAPPVLVESEAAFQKSEIRCGCIALISLKLDCEKDVY
ncbi:hypothetical protein LINPERHAP1_LOCUS18083, partial [Linum perenne]